MPVARRQRRIFQDCRTGYLSRGEENFTASIKEICHSPKQEQKQAFATVGQRFECVLYFVLWNPFWSVLCLDF
jgi:hypothetical protein